MIEGKVKLELFDGLTGKCQEKIESHNMMTGAIDKIVQFIMRHPYRGSRNYTNPFGQHLHLLQGVCLFDNVLPENVNQIWLPAGVKPTAYGVVGGTYNTQNAKMMGQYNPVDSDTSQDLVKKYVWDWKGFQGNGTVSSLSLTHYNAGFIGFGGSQQGAENNAGLGTRIKMIGIGSICESPANIPKAVPYSYWNSRWQNARYVGNVGANYMDMCLDSDGDYKYMFMVKSDGLSVIKHKMNFEHFDIFRSIVDWQEYEEEIYSGSYSGTYYRGFYNTDEKKLYFWIDDGAQEGDGGRWYPNNFSTTIYVYDIVNKTVATHGTFTNSIGDSIDPGIVVTNSAVYFRSYWSSNTKVYKYSFSSGSTIECYGQVNASGSGVRPTPTNFILNGIITFPFAKYGMGTTADILVDTSDDTVRYTVCGFQSLSAMHKSSVGADRWDGTVPVIPPYDNTQIAFGYGARNAESGTREGYPRIYGNCMSLETTEDYNGGYCDTFTLCNYLGTIFNLSESVVKTAQQDMKLTYTLTAHEEEGE